MEKINTSLLPSIFKLPVLCNILPYYGFLHQWKNMLELVCRKTNQIWKENHIVLKHLGRKNKEEININYHNVHQLNICILELFNLKTDCFNNYMESFCNERSKLSNSTFLAILSKLAKNRSCIIDSKNNWQFITALDENEASEFIPSCLCNSLNSNIREFRCTEEYELLKYITECTLTKRVIIKKIEKDIFEINSVIPNPFSNTQKYNILYHCESDNLNDYFSCPVINCICKPTTICWNSSTNPKINYDEYEEITVDVAEKILNSTLLNEAKQLNVVRKLNSFDSIFNLMKISKNCQNLKIKFDFDYSNFNTSSNAFGIIKSKQLNIVHKNRAWYLESCNDILV